VIRDSPSLSGSCKRVGNCLRGRAGADVVGFAEELAAQSDLIGICVAADDDVLQVVDSLRGGLWPGSIVAIHSTVLPAGTLSVMVGGDPVTFERVRPVFESFGSPQHLGPLDSGQVLKLLNNAMLMAHLRLAYDALELATTLGVESDLAREVLLQGSGGSAAMRTMIKFAEFDMIDVRSMLDKDFDHFREVISGMTAGRTIDRLGAELLDRLATEMLS
jgi:3-hydroxyisobutyrate dehydrogenase-like beta-hydroxyacid dehydrogenase